MHAYNQLKHKPDRRHANNWMVVRSREFAEGMSEIEGSIAFQYANKAIREMQADGPILRHLKNFTYDAVNDLYHCHAEAPNNSFIVLWEVQEDLRLIHILCIRSHENFKFKRVGDKQDSINRALAFMRTDPPPNPDGTQNQSHYKKMFDVKNMKTSEELRAIYDDFVHGRSDRVNPLRKAPTASSSNNPF